MGRATYEQELCGLRDLTHGTARILGALGKVTNNFRMQLHDVAGEAFFYLVRL